MADASYDAVVIGGGHHGTIIACYLQDAGLQTAIFERQHELGGGACNDELPLPAFIASTCSHFSRFYAHPTYEDFKLRDKGLLYITPDQGASMVFQDETCIISYPLWRVVDPDTGRTEFSAENAEKTFREIARFSERDAETAHILTEKYQRKWRDAFSLQFFNPPTPWGVDDALEQLFGLPEQEDGIDPLYQFMTVSQLAYDLFESAEMRTWMMRAFGTTNGCLPQDVPGVGSLIMVLGLILTWTPASIVVSGTHTITHALQRAFSEMGGKFFVHHEVDKVLIENGRAKGIRLADGTEIEARKLVVSTLDVNQLVFRLIGEEYFSPQVRRRVENFSYDRANLFWGPIVVYEMPKYKAASFNPDCGMQPRLYWGVKDPEYLRDKYQSDIFSRGYSENLYLFSGPDIIWDKTRAPEGKYTIHTEQFTCPGRFFSEREWLRLKKDFVKEMLRQWQWYAPNMTEDNLIDAHITTPDDTLKRNINMWEGSWSVGAMFASQMGRFRPIPELANHRTPIENIYHGSAATHFGGGIGRSGSYNCYKVIAEDLGLRKIWEEKGRPF